MLLGKRPRPRPPIKRTTSMSEITFDLDVDAISSSCSSTDTSPSPSPSPTSYDPFAPAADAHNQLGFGGTHLHQRSPRNYNRRASADILETAQFLRSCFLCNRRLVPTRDIYIYKGDSAFCSIECRQQQMSIDEKREKCSVVASKKEIVASSTATTDHVSTTNGEITTVAAV